MPCAASPDTSLPGVSLPVCGAGFWQEVKARRNTKKHVGISGFFTLKQLGSREVFILKYFGDGRFFISGSVFKSGWGFVRKKNSP
jgi:hypothetical protein